MYNKYKVEYVRRNKAYYDKNPDSLVDVQSEELLIGVLLLYPENFFKVDERLFSTLEAHEIYQCAKEIDGEVTQGTLMAVIQNRNIFDYALALLKEHNLEPVNVIDIIIFKLEKLRVLRLENLCSVEKISHKNNTENINIINQFLENELLPKFDLGYTTLSEDIDTVISNILSGNIGRYKSGVPLLDEKLSKFNNNTVITIAARPGMGKTTFSIQLIACIAKANKCGILMNTLEVDKLRLITKFLSYFSGFSEEDIRNNTNQCLSTPTFKDAEKAFKELDIEIVEGAYTPKELQKSVMLCNARRKTKGKEKILFVWQDYLQIKDTDLYNSNDIHRINEVLAQELRIAKKLGFILINLSQISRAVEVRGGSRRPQLSDLSGSGKIEMSSRIVLFLYRPEYYGILEDEDGNPTKNRLEVIIGKQNEGQTGIIFFNSFNPATNRFFDETIEEFNSSFPRADETDLVF